jgi:transcriptional regulator with XRE-family HTH domain
MQKRGDPRVLRLVVKFLRTFADMTQEEFGGAIHLDQTSVSAYELGHAAPEEEALRRMAAVAGLPWPVVVHLRRFYAAALSLADRTAAAVALADTAPQQVIVDAVLLAVTPHLLEQWTEPQPLEEALRQADEVWEALERFPPARRRRLIELSPRPSGNAALARRICEASERAATDNVETARELADLALFTARLVPEEGLRKRAEDFCSGYVANAQRVATDFDAANAGFVQLWQLWQPGDPAEPELFPEWRLHDLEASLRREQRLFTEALECIDRALALCGGQPAAAGRILLKKEHIFDAMGDTQGALAALAEAAPFVEAAADTDLLLRFRFNMADDLCGLGRYAEAAERLPAVRELAIEQGKKLDLIRVAWLTAKVDAGLGRLEEAMAGLEQVHQDFRAQDLPYEAALSSLDLAVLYLKEGRTAEVQGLAVAMGWIFTAKGIPREALAALSLFCEAAEQEGATVELAQRVSGEVERAERTATPS